MNNLELFTHEFLAKPESSIMLFSFALMLGGAALAALIVSNDRSMKRAPFFLSIAVLSVILSATQYIWLWSLPAFAEGYAWQFLMFEFSATVLFGFLVAVLAMRRSLDAFGTNRRAILAFIPLANIWLHLEPSKQIDTELKPSAGQRLKSFLSVLLSFALLAISQVLPSDAERRIEELAASTEVGGATQAMSIEAYLRANGLENTLKTMAAEVAPGRLDEATILNDLTAEGSTLTYEYELEGDIIGLTTEFTDGLIKGNCAQLGLRVIIDAGATLVHHYALTDGTTVERVIVDKIACEL